MKDEIKEILEIHIKYNEDLLPKNQQKVLDYITNLQDTLKDREEYCYGLETELTNLQEENEKLKENNKKKTSRCTERNHRIRCRERTIERRNKKISKLEDKIDKAIEYITSEETINMFSSINAREKWLKINHRLLSILKGDDKSE